MYENYFPDINYGESNKHMYTELINNSWSPFFEHSIWEIFIFCMSYAYAKKLNPKDPDGKGTLNSKVFKPNTRYIMYALAIDHYDDIEVIKNSNKVVKICEEYANVGIKKIYQIFKNKPSEVPIEKIFQDMISEINEE
ncbi:MAG: hypothetical protein K8823_777 [Cenarchaeum symbiont of Oopsacas minuta]|nr:hypothetical protein [Cenarchaeum symbiont of Oopsacas minuta]